MVLTRRKAIFIIIVGFFIPVVYLLVKRSYLKNKYATKELNEYRVLIAEIADMIIPRTDSPGAKDASVEDYIINVMQNCETKLSRSRFVHGLERLEKKSMSRFAMPFASCSNEDKGVLLQELENQKIPHAFLNKVKTKLLGPSFFDHFKQLTVKGYCMSKIGATEGLAYDPVPIAFISCIPYIPHQKAWATR